MSELQRLALTAVFIAAVVTAGLTLALVPNVELITLTVFCAGVLLGARRGALVGVVGMPLYVLANSALRGFAPSPLPVLCAQAAGMALAGLVGGGWAVVWRRPGPWRRRALLALPVIGFLLAALFQAMVNAMDAYLFSGGETSFTAFWMAGMSFGLVQMVTNTLLFALAGAPAVHMLRRLARERGWWPAATLLLLIGLGFSLPATAQEDTLEPILGPAPNQADSTADAPPAPPARSDRWWELREVDATLPGLWQDFSMARVAVLGLPSIRSGDVLVAREASRTTSPGMRPNLDRWGWGWDRLQLSFMRIPLSGRVHTVAEPVDLPLIWTGSWRERWDASGNTLDLGAPPSPGRDTQSQVSLTSGSYRKRTAEFAMVRNLGPVDVTLDFEDRFEGGVSLVNEIERSRLWVHVASVPGDRPDFTLGGSLGGRDLTQISGGEMSEGAKRFYGTLTGPVLGGETRLGVMWRRQSLRGPGWVELIMDGVTTTADWATPMAGLQARLVGDWERRRGGQPLSGDVALPSERTFRGGRGALAWSREGDQWTGGVMVGGGYQEPYRWTWQGVASLQRTLSAWTFRAAVSHDEDLPALVLGLDRPTPETGLDEHLERFETTQDPERRGALRLEGAGEWGRLRLHLGGWLARVTGYRLDSNPLWITPPYGPELAPDTEDRFGGAFGEFRFDLGRGFYADGRGRIHGRDAAQVPYLAQWLADGALHYRGTLLRSLALDIALGGMLIGPRTSPAGDRTAVGSVGNLVVVGRIDNGILTFALRNIADTAIASDLRFEDLNPVAIAPRTFSLGLTLYLLD